MNIDYRPQLNEMNWFIIAILILNIAIAIKVFFF